ncbi:MAG: SDR family NAD(P)-dependent oxidoreductase [Acidimicrobiia bacterium]
MGQLDGHTAVVTGGASGIGRATAQAMRAEGAAVTVIDTDADGAEAVADEIDGAALTTDVTDAEAMSAAIDTAAADMGGLSILFNNAGFSTIGAIDEWDVEEWHRVVAVNLGGVYHGIRAAVPHMMRGGDGRIVNMASISGVRPSAGESAYSAAKAGSAALTANAALEYGPTIRANAVSPGLIRTSLTEPLFELLPGYTDHVVEQTPVKRVGQPADIADVVVFLCSDAARFVTGQNIIVDGGLTLHGAGVDGVLERVRDLMGGTGAS